MTTQSSMTVNTNGSQSLFEEGYEQGCRQDQDLRLADITYVHLKELLQSMTFQKISDGMCLTRH